MKFSLSIHGKSIYISGMIIDEKIQTGYAMWLGIRKLAKKLNKTEKIFTNGRSMNLSGYVGGEGCGKTCLTIQRNGTRKTGSN